VLPHNHALILSRAGAAGIAIGPELSGRCSDYLDLLTKWNRRINLTALPLDPPTDAAIDRLIIEPLIASTLVRPDDRVCIDVGSGGGSPALPLALAQRNLQMLLVESRARKASFLREAIRHLAVGTAAVENCRLEDLAKQPARHGGADLVTMRAVRLTSALVLTLGQLLRPKGRFLFFGDLAASDIYPLEVIDKIDLTAGERLTVASKTGELVA
jgi:16S rRNA (guanine527-N7)-methyltransferase